MHVGMSVIFQNPGERIPDQQVYQQDLALALQAEGLGFDSVWSVEHHFTDGGATVAEADTGENRAIGKDEISLV